MTAESNSDSGSSKEGAKTEDIIMDRGRINFNGDYGAAIAAEHHQTHHQHQEHGQSRHNDPSNSASHKDNGSGIDSFDFYVYSMSYQPEFCRETLRHPNTMRFGHTNGKSTGHVLV
jgi:ribonuclease I